MTLATIWHGRYWNVGEGVESTERRHDICFRCPQDRGAGREESRPAARRGRTPDARRGLCRGDLAPSRQQGRVETPAGALLLPHHGGAVPGGLPAPRRRGPAGARREALQSPQPLWALWRFGTDPAFTRISMEFMALANHRKEMRAEIAYYAERFRDEQRQAVAAALQRYGEDSSTLCRRWYGRC